MFSKKKEAFKDPHIANNKNSMPYSTKSKAQRNERIVSLFNYCTAPQFNNYVEVHQFLEKTEEISKRSGTHSLM